MRRRAALNRIKELRKQKGVKQADLAKLLGIAQSTMSGWENEINEVDNDSLFKLADFFGVSVDYILGRDTIPDDINTDDDFAYALYNEAKELTDEDKKQLIKMAQFLKAQHD